MILTYWFLVGQNFLLEKKNPCHNYPDFAVLKIYKFTNLLDFLPGKIAFFTFALAHEW